VLAAHGSILFNLKVAYITKRCMSLRASGPRKLMKMPPS
jgi:hypothetical protein